MKIVLYLLPLTLVAQVQTYRSRIDGSTQPYALHIPANYDAGKPTRLDVVLHGRNQKMDEAGYKFTGSKIEPKNYLVLEVFGRGNNAYRWAGETDVFEALAAVREK